MTRQDPRNNEDNTPATKGDLRALAKATKGDLRALAKATKGDLRALAKATKGDMQALAKATKGDMQALAKATKGDLHTMKDELLEEMDKRIEARAPATKTDIEGLMKEIGKLYMANERWKNEILDSMDTRFETFGKKLVDQFGVIAENLYYDYFGGEKDRVQDHERRIVVLERKTGIHR